MRSKTQRREAPIRTTKLPSTAWLSHLASRARMLDLEADIELQHGHIATAEHLSRCAAALRDGMR